MLFNSTKFMIFLPIVVLLNYCIPKRFRTLWLLVASYYFYMSWNAGYAVLILFSTVVTYGCGLLLQQPKMVQGPEAKAAGRRKRLVAVGVLANLAVLFYFKYANFTVELLRDLFAGWGIELNIPAVDVLLPVGISFYTFQALGYLIDVYRGTIPAERNFLRYALFVSFFPQLVAGPIERSKNLLGQLAEPKKFSFDRFRDGFLLMLWGFFLKIVLADRIAIFVNTVYGDVQTYGGTYILVATILFAFQIYCDFYGYSVIAVGSAQILGIQLMENFQAPYFSTSVAGFWRHWHISLTSWFKDYLYIPLGGSRKGRGRKYLNQMIVFLTSGLWHGASLSFVFWGGLNGLYQVVGDVLQPVRTKVTGWLGLHRESLGHRVLCACITFALVDFSWLFFRAGTMTQAIEVLNQFVTVSNPSVWIDGSLFTCGLDAPNFWLMLIGLGILAMADLAKARGVALRRVILRQDPILRWVLISAMISAILLFGVWGPQYIAANFIYFQF